MSGPIVPEDVKAFKEWLLREPYTHIVMISSPGGSIEAAMEIGRLIRSRFMQVRSYKLEPREDRGCSPKQALEIQQELGKPTDDASIKERQAICQKLTDCRVENRCCLSACVLVLAGGAMRWTENAGLHRPGVGDFSDRSYEDVRTTLSRGHRLIEQYLNEMEVSQNVFTTMMQIPPGDMRLLDAVEATTLFAGLPGDKKSYERYEKSPESGFAASIYDWLKPKCDHLPAWQLEDCLWIEMNKESVRRATRLSP